MQKENDRDIPVLGNRWQARMGNRCLPRAQKKPRYVIPNNKLEDYCCYMKYHAFICKFIGFWPSEKDLTKWIQLRWKPKGHIDLKLGAKGFFTLIFANLEDKERSFEEGPYFMHNAGLFMRHWEDRYNPDAEKLLAAPIWVRLYGLPTEFWDPDILEGIGNSIGAFVKVAESTKRGKYTSYARICVYMNIAEPLPEYIEVEYHDEIWKQPIDYEHIPFRCRRCHEYGHLYRQCPQNREGEVTRIMEEEKRKVEGSDIRENGFKEVQRRQKPRQEGTRGQPKEKNIPVENQNKFQVLQDEEEEIEGGKKAEEDDENAPKEIIIETIGKSISQNREGEVEMGESQENIVEQMQRESENRKDNGAEEERIMKKLLQEWKNLDERFIPESQKQQYKEAFQKYKENKGSIPEIGIDQTGS